jgi:hypothetical protein
MRIHKTPGSKIVLHQNEPREQQHDENDAENIEIFFDEHFDGRAELVDQPGYDEKSRRPAAG